MHTFLPHVEGGAARARPLIIQRTRDEPRRRGLADAAHPGQHIGLRDAPRSERVPQRPHHGVLPDQLGEDLRPVFAGKRRVALRRRRRRSGSSVRLALGRALRRALLSVFDFSHGRMGFSTQRLWLQTAGTAEAPRHTITLKAGGRLDEQPAMLSLGLLPSGPDPVGEGRACRQPPSRSISGIAAPVATRRTRRPIWRYNPPCPFRQTLLQGAKHVQSTHRLRFGVRCGGTPCCHAQACLCVQTRPGKVSVGQDLQDGDATLFLKSSSHPSRHPT